MSEEKELITELKSVVNQYNPMTKVYTAIALILIFVVGVALSIAIGEFFLIIMVMIGAWVFNRLGISIKLKRDSIPEEKLSYEACCIMENLIYNKTHPSEHSSTRANISTVGIGSHQELYQSFIQHYPSLASKKLRALACVTLKYEDFG